MAGKKRADRLEFWDAERMAMPIGTLISVLSATAKKYKGEGYSHLRFVFDYGWGDEDDGCYLYGNREEPFEQRHELIVTETSDKEK